jgi:large subunit ribosomal protein L15
MDLKTVKSAPASRSARKRIGRGTGSGKGKTAGKGHKGQKCRSGYKWHAYFEGGQMPLFRRLPKKGFNNGRFRRPRAIINVKDLNRFPAGAEVDPEAVQKAGLVKDLETGLKVLGKGEIEVALTVRAHHFSETARRKIADAGGTVEVLAGRASGKRRKS